MKIKLIAILILSVISFFTQSTFAKELSAKPKWSFLQSEMELIQQVAYSPNGNEIAVAAFFTFQAKQNPSLVVYGLN